YRSTLNCYAAHGGLARDDTCPGVTTTSCSTASNACYYDAVNPESLVNHLAKISEEIVSCGFQLTDPVADPSQLIVFFEITADGSMVALGRDPTRQQNWDYDAATNQILFFGYACDAVRRGTAVPYVSDGCE
ncbi:MAG: hypothetical protein HYZ27_01560, partial [Deltaproteobacteria bacterium]|nr:hypothetical protein [Deltaproteobacteria bacterium]